MPIYEYHCNDCLKDHEIIQKVNDPLLAICPACGGTLEKKLSLGGFQLKGSGWYKDGYASPKPADSKKEGTKQETTKKESKAETKSTESSKGKDVTTKTTPVKPSSQK